MESIKNAIAGAVLRPWIKKKLGKDWYNSWTMWGIVIYAMAEAGAEMACELGALSVEQCFVASRWVENVGKVLVILGVRRAALNGGANGKK